MVEGETRGACSMCNAKPGDRVTITFTPREKSVTVRLCEECYADFAADDGLELTPVED